MRLGIGVFYPEFSFAVGCEFLSVFKFFVVKLFQSEVSAAACQSGFERFGAVVSAVQFHGYHGYVFVVFHSIKIAVIHVAKIAGGVESFGKFAFESASSVYNHAVPCYFLHGILGFHPRSARATPARRCGNRYIHVERIGKTYGIFQTVFPLGRKICYEFRNYLRASHSGIEHVETGDSRVVHPENVFAYSVFRHISVHPMPPNLWTRLGGRVLKIFIYVVRLGVCINGGKQKQCGCNHRVQFYKFHCFLCLFVRIVSKCNKVFVNTNRAVSVKSTLQIHVWHLLQKLKDLRSRKRHKLYGEKHGEKNTWLVVKNTRHLF